MHRCRPPATGAERAAREGSALRLMALGLATARVAEQVGMPRATVTVHVGSGSTA